MIGDIGFSVFMTRRLLRIVEAIAGYCSSVMVAASSSIGTMTARFHFSLAPKVRCRMRTTAIRSDGRIA